MSQAAIPRVDLHTHTTASDGSLAPHELIDAALAQGLTTIAVTDHDTTAGIAPALLASQDTDLEVLPGIELSIRHGDRSFHLLGYGFDAGSRGLRAALDELRDHRAQRARQMVARLSDEGATIDWRHVAALGRGTVGRPHIARALVDAGFARDVADAFKRYVGNDCPAYIPSSTLGAVEGIAIVRAAGGEAALAHAMRPGKPYDLNDTLAELMQAGLSGIEIYHSEHDDAARAHLRSVAAREGLWWCGGSDFHGPSKPHTALGCANVPPEVLEQGPFRAAKLPA